MEAYNPRETGSTKNIELYNLAAETGGLINSSSLEAPSDSPAFLNVEQARNQIKSLFARSEPEPDSLNSRLKAQCSDESSPQRGYFKKIKYNLKDALPRGESIRNCPRLKIRAATEFDIPGMVEVDLVAFRSVYRHYDITAQELKNSLLAKFDQRFKKVGRRWITVLERDHKIVGFIAACPTSKPPEYFVYWEDTTDDGTLETTYDPNGEYLYAVSLSVLPEASRVGGHNMLMVNLISKIVADNYTAYFESRVPGLKRWVLKRCREDDLFSQDLSNQQKQRYAEEYFELNTKLQANQLPPDPLLKTYYSMGCRFAKLVPNAYQDELSMNYGVVAVYESPLPKYLQRIRPIRKTTAAALNLVSHSPFLTQKTF